MTDIGGLCARFLHRPSLVAERTHSSRHRTIAMAGNTGDLIRLKGSNGAQTVVRNLPDMKYGKLFAEKALYDYMVTHSYVPNGHLDQLHKVTMEHTRAEMCSPPDSVPFLQLMMKLVNAKKVVEVGVFTGYTTLAMALSLPEGGKIVACDISDEYATIGKGVWEAAGVDAKIDLRIAPATDTMQGLLQDGEEGNYDMGFIDADKPSYDSYYELVLKLLRPGGVCIVDNTLWDGRVIKPEVQDDATKAIRALNEKIYKDDRVIACMLPVSDGVTVVLKK